MLDRIPSARLLFGAADDAAPRTAAAGYARFFEELDSSTAKPRRALLEKRLDSLLVLRRLVGQLEGIVLSSANLLEVLAAAIMPRDRVCRVAFNSLFDRNLKKDG